MFSLRYRHNTSDPDIHTFGYKDKGDTDSQNKRSDEEDKDEEKASDYYNEKSPYSKRTAQHYHNNNMNSLVPYPGHVCFEFILAFIVRLWHSGVPQFLTQSELILAQQVNWTLKGQFHIGITPPLATMIYSLVARWTGYQGSESILYAGQTLHEFPLATLRHVTMFTSSLIIPAIYMFVRMLGCAHATALFTSGLFIFETGMVIQSRYISVDPLLTLLCCLACCSFFVPGPSSFHRRFLTGTLLGSALCTKWQAGSFIAFFLSVSTYEIWLKICDPTVPLKKVPKFVIGQLLTLLGLPICVYIALFHYHFHKVPGAGDHDMFLSSPLRYSLVGNSFEPVQQYIAYGSHVVLKHVSSNNGYLHSDDKIFTAGSKQNQVTVYPYEDINNIWVIQKLDTIKYSQTDLPDYLYNNNAFKLEHYASTRKLHSHDHNAPIHSGEGFYEVTSYGNPTVTNDGNDVWWIRVVTEDEGYDTSNHDPINALTTRFRMLHSKGCYLSSHYTPLPLADGAQQEVSCMNSAKTSVASWVFEYAHHPKLVENISPTVQYGHPTFRKKMEQVHKLMKNYKKVVYDKLSSLPADVLESTETMMDSDNQPEPFTWMRHIYAQVIWDDLTGRSVYLVLHPILRHVTLVCIASLPMIALFSALSAQLGWTRLSLWCQHFWSGRHIQTATMMTGGALVNTISILLSPPHTVTMADLIPTILLGTIAFASLMEWFMVADNFQSRRQLTSSNGESTSTTQPGIFFTTPSIPPVTDQTRQKLHQWVIYILITLHILSFLRWSRGIDGSHMWTSGQCKQFSVKNVDCEKYPSEPPLSPNLSAAEDLVSVVDSHLMEDSPQEDHDNIMESRHIMMPGTPFRFEYERGQEIRAEMEIAKVRDKAYRQANDFSVPAHRFVRAAIDPGPTLEEVLDLRHQMYFDAMQKEGGLSEQNYADGIEIYAEEDEAHLARKKKRAAKKNKKRKAKKVKKTKASKLTGPELDDTLHLFPEVDLTYKDE